jgi:hypothetical protein
LHRTFPGNRLALIAASARLCRSRVSPTLPSYVNNYGAGRGERERRGEERSERKECEINLHTIGARKGNPTCTTGKGYHGKCKNWIGENRCLCHPSSSKDFVIKRGIHFFFFIKWHLNLCELT